MADPRFFDRAGPFSLGQLAEIGQATLSDGADPARLLHDVAALDDAGAEHLSFLDNRAYVPLLRESGAGACVLAPATAKHAPAGMPLLISDAPYRSYALMAQAFYPQPSFTAGIAPSAIVDPDATLGAGCRVEAGAVIGAGAELGEGCIVGANATIGRGVVLGEGCRIGANVTLSHCLIGARVTIYPGSRIGQDGFGFAPHPSGYVKVPQVGRVIIADDCEIGANVTIDRGSTRDTMIGRGCWIDNLVQIGHNVVLGQGCIVVAMVGISGSTTIGSHVAIGGQAGLAGHLKIGDGAQIAAQAGVMTDVPAGARIAGSPAQDAKDEFRQIAMLRRMERPGAKKG